MSYQVLRKLQEGGFSEVFEVRDPQSALDEILILKRLSTEMSARPEVHAAFTREGEILSNLRHPNIVTFRRCFYDQGRICLLMEKVEGQHLDAWVQEHRGEPAEVLGAFAKVLAAVDHLHHRSSPLLHLDLKPENILMTRIGSRFEPVLIDFGISRVSGHHGLNAYTPPYAAPEQKQGGQLGGFTDVHALGQILGELLDTLRPSLDPGRFEDLVRVATRARAPSRRSRYADAGEMMHAFHRASAAAPTPDLSRWVLPAVVASAAGLALVALGVWWPFRSTRLAEPPVAPAAAPAAAASVESLEQCLHLAVSAGEASSMEHGIDRCVERILSTEDLGRMEAGFLEARRFARSRQYPRATQEIMERKLEHLKYQIDLRTTVPQR